MQGLNGCLIMVLGGQIESPNIEVMQHGFAFPTCIAGLLGPRVIDWVDVGGGRL